MKLLLIILLFPLAAASQIQGKAVAITDGDTFTLLTIDQRQIKIRLYGIDCPEKGQAFGTKAKEKLSELIFGKYLTVTDRGLDRYGRTLGMVFHGELNICEEMIRTGFAWHFIRYDSNKAWDLLEEQARREKVGLWSDPEPVAPWIWRKQN